MQMRVIVFGFVCFLALTNAWAEHEVDHRYSVRGYVLDENNDGIDKVDVVVSKGSTVLKNTKTDSSGYYSMHLHLHNTDNGQKLRLRAGSSQAEIRVNFDPGDITTLRVHDANFVAGKFVDGSLNRFRMPPWVYPLVGLMALVFVVVMLEKRRRKKIRLAKTGTSPKSSKSGQGKSRKRRKKH